MSWKLTAFFLTKHIDRTAFAFGIFAYFRKFSHPLLALASKTRGRFLFQNKLKSGKKSAKNDSTFGQISKFLKKILNPLLLVTYACGSAQKSPNFRIKRAGMSNYRGAAFFRLNEKTKLFLFILSGKACPERSWMGRAKFYILNSKFS